MAATSLQSLQLHRQHRRLLHPPDSSYYYSSSSLFFKSTKSSALFSTKLYSTLSPSSSTPSSSTTTNPTSLELLSSYLEAKNYRQADEETRRLLIALAGDAAIKRGYVFFSEVQFISESDLRAIDLLWRTNSDGKFGYSVQKRIWQKVRRDFTKFFLKVGWMKKLDTEIEQFGYRSFPTEFLWDLESNTPEGHLPLTNALRGTQLLASIFTHPAFITGDNEEELAEEEVQTSNETTKKGPSLIPKRALKSDYSF